MLIGYFIRRTWAGPRVDGKTWCAYPQRLYPTRRDADDALSRQQVGGGLDPDYEYDIAEAYMHVEEEQ